jgi:tripartite-type tricarboxylate transporter receptor subunit TctC
MTRRRIFGVLAMAALGTIPLPSVAQSFPSKPIRIVVPFPPGGTTDIMARAMATQMNQSLNVPVLVENRVGGSALVGTEHVARSAADGYTLLMAGSPHGINNSLRKNVPYDPVKSFAPVSLIGTVPMILTVHPSVPAKTYEEFVAYGRANPNKLKFGVTPATGSHLATELFAKMTGIQFVSVPYKGDAPTVTDLVGGHVDAVILISTQVLPHIRDGRLRALAVTGKSRMASMKQLPTLAESGLAGYEAGSWNGVFAPAGTPAETIRVLSEALQKGARDPKVVEQFTSIGIDIRATGPKELGDFLDGEVAKWGDVIRSANISVD